MTLFQDNGVMSLDTYTFFLIVLGGTMIVWSYRKVSRSSYEIKELEYLVFSCFWGTLMVMLYAQITNPEKLATLLGNPFATGLVFGLCGLITGAFAASINRQTKLVSGIKRLLLWLEKKMFS